MFGGGPTVYDAWQLRLPLNSTDILKYAPTISLVTSELNPPYMHENRKVQAFLNKDGSVREGVLKTDPSTDLRSGYEKVESFNEDNPGMGTYPGDGYNEWTEDEMKEAVNAFVANSEQIDPGTWNIHYENQKTGKVTEMNNWFVDDKGRDIIIAIRETGRISLGVYDKSKESPRHKDSKRSRPPGPTIF